MMGRSYVNKEEGKVILKSEKMQAKRPRVHLWPVNRGLKLEVTPG